MDSATELKFETVMKVNTQLKLKILIFDLWVENEDRTLSEKGGNPNLLWKSDESGLYVIDHNLIFEDTFNKCEFWKTHVFKSALGNQADLHERIGIENKLKHALACWKPAWDNLPKEWIDWNIEFNGIDPEKHLQRLISEANGDIWLKLP